jgi:ParB family chromosome partitioning protein
MTGIEQQAVSRWAARLEDRDAYRQSLVGAAYRAALLTAAENHRAQGTGDNEWYTPPEYVEAARAVLGEIDLDPASSDVAQRTVKASRYFTREQDGLTQAWPGRVWLNPPYTQPDVGRFVGKLVDELERHQTEAAILLTHNYTDTAWFHLAASVCQAICFTRGRIGFLDSRGNAAAPTQGQAFFYYGLDVEAFRARFTEIGALMRPL